MWVCRLRQTIQKDFLLYLSINKRKSHFKIQNRVEKWLPFLEFFIPFFTHLLPNFSLELYLLATEVAQDFCSYWSRKKL